MGSRSTTSLVLAIASIMLFLAGFVFLAFYVTSVSGPHLRYLGAGFLAACAAFVVGCLIGLIVGIPRFVSSGAMRHAIEAKVARTATPGRASARVAPAAAPGGTAGGQPGGTAGGQPGGTAGGRAPQQPQAAPVSQSAPVSQPAPAVQPGPGAQGGSTAGQGSTAQSPMGPMGPMTPMTLVASGSQQQSVRSTDPDGFPAITDQAPAVQGSGDLGGSGDHGGGSDQGGAAQTGSDQSGSDQSGSDQSGGAEVGQLTPSTNLAEISDWLTKLLLGAGLVSLTRLGHPLSQLIDAVARGLQGVPTGGAVSGTPVIIAASMLVMYVVLGFLDGYVVTTLWYGKYLERLGYS